MKKQSKQKLIRQQLNSIGTDIYNSLRSRKDREQFKKEWGWFKSF